MACRRSSGTFAVAEAPPATPTRAGWAAHDNEVTPPVAPSKSIARRDPTRRRVARPLFADVEGVRLQAATRLQAAARGRSTTLRVQGLRNLVHDAATRIQAAWRRLQRIRWSAVFNAALDAHLVETWQSEAAVDIQAAWRGARVRATAQPGPCPEVRDALLRGFDAHAAGALFAARWAAATAQEPWARVTQ